MKSGIQASKLKAATVGIAGGIIGGLVGGPLGLVAGEETHQANQNFIIFNY
jgi:hypothetical protein